MEVLILGVYLEILLFRIKWSKIRVRIIHERALYTGKYGKHQVRQPIVSWSHHGLSLLAVPEHYIVLDITINMDVQSQPGPAYASSAEISSLRAGSRTGSLSSGVCVRQCPFP